MDERYDPYFAPDTDGVHFQVNVAGRWVSAHVTRGDLARVYGPCDGPDGCMDVFRLHEQFLRQTAIRHAAEHGPETVILGYDVLIRSAIDLTRNLPRAEG